MSVPTGTRREEREGGAPVLHVLGEAPNSGQAQTSSHSKGTPWRTGVPAALEGCLIPTPFSHVSLLRTSYLNVIVFLDATQRVLWQDRMVKFIGESHARKGVCSSRIITTNSAPLPVCLLPAQVSPSSPVVNEFLLILISSLWPKDLFIFANWFLLSIPMTTLFADFSPWCQLEEIVVVYWQWSLKLFNHPELLIFCGGME